MSARKPQRRGGRSAAKAIRNAAAVPVFERHQNLRLQVVGTSDSALIHGAALDILWTKGVLVADAWSRQWLIAEHGCIERDNEYVGFPRDLVSAAIDTAPKTLKLYDQDGQVKVDTEVRRPQLCVGHNCVSILDHETGEHRPGLLSDIQRNAKITEALPNLDVVASLGYPTDVPPNEESRLSAKAMTDNTRKPVAFTAHDEIISEQIWAHLSEVSGGWDNLAEKPIGLDLAGPVSPLRMTDELCRKLKFTAERNLPIVCYPALFPGMAGPITLAGAIAQSSAEALAGLVIHQLCNPGAPILFGSAILPMDLRRADLAYGSSEYMLANLGASDYFNYLGLPNWIGAGCSDAHIPDAQAAAEVGSNMTVAALAGTPFIHNVGYLSGGRTGSVEMLVLCDELAGHVSRFAHGLPVSTETIAVDVIKRASDDNSFLTDDHTVDRYQSESWMPAMLERSDVRQWKDDGAKDINEKVKDKLSQILAT